MVIKNFVSLLLKYAPSCWLGECRTYRSFHLPLLQLDKRKETSKEINVLSYRESSSEGDCLHDC